MDKLAVGDFITYDKYYMAILSIQNGKIYTLCTDNEKIASFPEDDPKAKLFRKGGCKSLVRSVKDDMNYWKRMVNK